MAGAASLLGGEAKGRGADANYRAANAYTTSTGGGAGQIERNTIAELVLGLPREMEVDRSLRFRESRAVTG